MFLYVESAIGKYNICDGESGKVSIPPSSTKGFYSVIDRGYLASMLELCNIPWIIFFSIFLNIQLFSIPPSACTCAFPHFYQCMLYHPLIDNIILSV